MTQSDAETLVCMQCEQRLDEDQERETTQEGVLCRTCYDSLAAQVKQLVEQQGEDINYPMAFVGALLGGIIGAIVWWGFTSIIEAAFGLVAVVIGFTVGKGILILTGGKRSMELQIMAVTMSALAYFYANYLVQRTMLLKELPGMAERFGIIPDFNLFIEVSRLSFSMFTVIFLGIVVWQAWALVAPAKLE